MNVVASFGVCCCPRCGCASEIVVLEGNGESVVMECHACLTLQHLPAPPNDRQVAGEIVERFVP